MLPLLLALGLISLLASSRKGGAAPKPKTPADIAQRIVRETNEILDGKRDAYTDDDAPAPPAASARSSSSSSSSSSADPELAQVRKAVALAKQKEAGSSGPSVTVGPITQKKPAPAKGAAAPAGADLALAKSTAPKVAAHLKQAGVKKYDHKVLALWQTRAGITADGVYGRGAAAALKYFTPAAPPAFFAQGTASYTPPRG